MFRDYGFVEDWPTAWNWASPDGNNFAFLAFPDDVVAINPSSDLLRRVVHSNMSLEEYQSMAMAHTESLSSGDLELFANAAGDELFLTSDWEDEIILSNLLLEQEEVAHATKTSNTDIQDKISAVRYRLAHKRALLVAQLCCNTILTKRISDGEL